MVCRHGPNDPNCSNHKDYVSPYRNESNLDNDNSPDSKKYAIEKCEIIENNIILMVNYPSCRKCAYEGNKILVYLKKDIKDIIFWKEIDPHFKDPKKSVNKTQAPAPNARFPANDEGWKDAINYVKMKIGKL
jgi:hypothetical protein